VSLSKKTFPRNSRRGIYSFSKKGIQKRYTVLPLQKGLFQGTQKEYAPTPKRPIPGNLRRITFPLIKD
jgi:hypothetical protein